jgi:hypothetical protein
MKQHTEKSAKTSQKNFSGLGGLSKYVLRIKNAAQNIFKKFFVSAVFNKNVIFIVLLMII